MLVLFEEVHGARKLPGKTCMERCGTDAEIISLREGVRLFSSWILPRLFSVGLEISQMTSSRVSSLSPFIASFHEPWVPCVSHIVHPRPHFHFPKQSISSSQGETRQSREQYDCYEHIDRSPSANLSRASKRRSSSRFHPPIVDRRRREIADRLNQRSA